MIVFPCAKINLGLNITGKREDGFHDLETVFYPIPLCDALEIKYMGDEFPSDVPCDLKVTGNTLDCDEMDNLVVRAYDTLAAHYALPRIHAHLYKHIPSGAGLGGGSADAAFMIRLLDERFRLNLGNAEMERHAAQLGADCPFFITAEPAFAQGKGEILSPMPALASKLQGLYVAVVKPDIAVSTRQAYSMIAPAKPATCCRDIVRQPIETWRDQLVNDFEKPLFAMHPILADIKSKLYDEGAIYASMSGSGSALYGLFKRQPSIDDLFTDCFTCMKRL